MAEDWRQKFLDLADEHERGEKQHTATERDLIRLVTRLCVAVSGLDATLDPHLERLRRASKSGDASRLLEQADELADALVHASEERTRPGILQFLGERAGLSARQAKDVLQAWKTVAEDPSAASDRDLDRLAEQLRKVLPEKSSEGAATVPQAGLLGRLLGRSDGAASDDTNELLSKLLDDIAWPDGLQGAIDACRGHLGQQAPRDAWQGVVREVSDIAIQALAEERANAEAAERFLSELGTRLEDLDRHMLAQADHHQAVQASGARLDRSMSEEVERLSDDVRQSNDLAQLQARVLASLDRMQAHVREHVEDENQRRAAAEAEAAILRDKMRDLERDSFDLRRQVAQTQEKAFRDALTGLPNRHAYDERVAQEQARFRRFGDPLAILVLDVDNFKVINDTHGHKAGDKALAMIAKILNQRLRATDFIARFGGEEFVLLLTGAGLDDAMHLADEMRAAVERGGLHASGQPVKVTLSGGLTLFREDETAGSAFERADRALYQAKGEGKNRIVSA
jgi:diguanylate cyclase